MASGDSPHRMDYSPILLSSISDAYDDSDGSDKSIDD
jgi:hypothetical protein